MRYPKKDWGLINMWGKIKLRKALNNMFVPQKILDNYKYNAEILIPLDNGKTLTSGFHANRLISLVASIVNQMIDDKYFSKEEFLKEIK